MPKPISYLSHLECARCGKCHSFNDLQTTCACGGPLLCRYDLPSASRELDKKELTSRPPGIWRYRELLPSQDPDRAVTLGEGSTPLLPSIWGRKHGIRQLWIKDEGLNPTGTFKARGAAVAVTRLQELGVKRLTMSSSGNAGDAWAAYCRRAGIEATIFLPADAPLATLTEALLTGESVYTFEGHNARGGKLAKAYAEAHQVFCPNTFQEPYRVEGKKTMGIELAEQLDWRMPDVVVYPIGGGVGLIGIWKALCELREVGWVTGSLPRFIVAQYDGCAPVAKAFEQGDRECEMWGDISTLPGGLRAPKPLADFLVLQILRETNGSAIAVSGEEALAAVGDVMKSDGLFMCPEAGTAIVALTRLINRGVVGPEERIVLVNTGSGLKYSSLFHDNVRRVEDGVPGMMAEKLGYPM
jgi:threonine synthase